MEEVLKTHTEENIIYDGFLRNSWNLEVFNKFIPEYKVVLFELDLIKARDRLYNRVYDPETGETFSSDIEINPKNGNKLIKREDDKDIESIKRRFNEFVEKTLPIIERQQEQ
jgi:adenylate kinase